MLVIREASEENLRTLKLDDTLFHRALKAVLLGEKRFHVKNPQGDDFDLEFTLNNDILSGAATAKDYVIFPPFYDYDEYDDEKLYLDFLADYEAVIFEEVNEYSIVLAKILLRKSSKKIYFDDERINWFIEKNPRLLVVSQLPEHKENKNFLCTKAPCIGYAMGDSSIDCSQSLFLNVFVLQWLTDLSLSEIKYAEVMIPKITGIGGILTHYTRLKNVFASLGIKSYLKPESTRFGDENIESYFNIDMVPEDSDDSNTIYLTNFASFITTRLCNSARPDLDENVLNKKLIQEISEYREAVLGDKKVLGILARGTDYIVGSYSGTRKHATVEQMLPTIREWMEKEQYDLIFLATEDQDILEQMLDAFPDKVRAIAQERHRVSDFKDNEVIAQMEKRERSGQDYLDALIDTTANYFYALYILSCCDSFMVSGQCNGWDTVLAFNHGRFAKTYKFQVGVR